MNNIPIPGKCQTARELRPGSNRLTYVSIQFHIQPDDPELGPYVSIWLRKWHWRRPGAPSVGRVLLATLNAVGTVRTGRTS